MAQDGVEAKQPKFEPLIAEKNPIRQTMKGLVMQLITTLYQNPLEN